MANDKTEEAVKAAGDALTGLGQSASDVAQKVAGHGREAVDQLRRSKNDLVDEFESAVKERPITAIGVAIIIGLSLGALWKV